jgi:hypothetical protein
LREISKEGLIPYPKSIRYSHLVPMHNRFALKGKFILQLIDDAKRDDKKLYIIAAYSTQTLYFMDLLKLDSSDHLTVA